jgi:hypothetical protein
MMMLALMLALASTDDVTVNQPQLAESPTEICELHIWPSEGLVVQTHGMWDGFRAGNGGGIIGAALASANSPERRAERSKKDATTIRPQEGGPLSPTDQNQLIKNADLASLLKLQGYDIVVHDAPLDSTTIRNTTGRLASQSAACYAELVIDDVVYSREWANGIKLKSFLRFRNFGTEQSVSRSFGSWVQSDLKIDPEDNPEKRQEIQAEMEAAFGSNFQHFSNYLNPPEKKKKGSKKN